MPWDYFPSAFNVRNLDTVNEMVTSDSGITDTSGGVPSYKR